MYAEFYSSSGLTGTAYVPAVTDILFYGDRAYMLTSNGLDIVDPTDTGGTPLHVADGTFDSVLVSYPEYHLSVLQLLLFEFIEQNENTTANALAVIYHNKYARAETLVPSSYTSTGVNAIKFVSPEEDCSAPRPVFSQRSGDDNDFDFVIKDDGEMPSYGLLCYQFEHEDFYRFADRLAKAGITVPVQAGIMPLVKKSHVDKTIGLSGAKLPGRITRMIARFYDDPESLMASGIAYATDQIADLLSAGVSGIHLYVMNNPYVARTITANVSSILSGVNR